jgi:hypothetical protein
MNRRVLLALLLALLLLIAPHAAARCPPGTLTGEATYIRDGDTIELGVITIRLQGIGR